MAGHKLELPKLEGPVVSLGEPLPERAVGHLSVINPNRFMDLPSWPEAPSPSTLRPSKEVDLSPSLPLYKDRKRLVVFIGLMIAWLFKGFDDTVIIGSIMCILADSASVFIAGRVVTGIGIAAGVPLCATILIDITSPEERPTYMASCVGVDIVSLAFGALLGGYLETKMDYRWAFAFTIFGALLSVTLIAVAYDQPYHEKDTIPASEHLRRFDFFGFGLLSMFSVFLLVGIQLAAQSNEWKSTSVISCLVVSAIVLPCFIVHQAKHNDPDNRLLPRGLFSRDVSLLLAFGFFTMFAMYGVYYYLSTYFQTVKGLSSFDAAVSLLAFFLASGVSSILAGVSMTWLPSANIIILLAATLSLVGTFLLTTMDEHTELLRAGLLSIISAMGFGASQTLAIVFSQSWVAKQHESFIVSVALMVQLFGGTLGLVLGGLVLNTQILDRVEKLNTTLTEEQISVVAMALAKPDRIRDFVPQQLIMPLLDVFSSSVRIVFYTCGAAAGIAWILAISMRWHKINH
ncbi:hypothetical protein TruAng_001330 [Truncatella angustata]|nr:hypothetical protein TruAng_001330 [Truncatella angustata]